MRFAPKWEFTTTFSFAFWKRKKSCKIPWKENGLNFQKHLFICWQRNLPTSFLSSHTFSFVFILLSFVLLFCFVCVFSSSLQIFSEWTKFLNEFSWSSLTLNTTAQWYLQYTYFLGSKRQTDWEWDRIARNWNYTIYHQIGQNFIYVFNTFFSIYLYLYLSRFHFLFSIKTIKDVVVSFNYK